MENLMGLITELRDLYAQIRADRNNDRPIERVQTLIRNKVKDQLARADLRVAVEVALTEMLHEFDGFDAAEQEFQESVLADTERLLNRIESLVETENALARDRIELPPPPPILAEVVDDELRRIEREDRERRRRQEPERRPHRAEDGEERAEGGRDRDFRGQRRRSRPPAPAGDRPVNKPVEAGPPKPADGQPAQPGDRTDLKFQHGGPKGTEGGSNANRRRRRGRRR